MTALSRPSQHPLAEFEPVHLLQHIRKSVVDGWDKRLAVFIEEVYDASFGVQYHHRLLQGGR